MKEFIERICKLNSSFEDDISIATSELRRELWKTNNHNQKSRYIYKFLMQCFSFQGISDRAAITYRDEHGDITFFQINKKLSEYKNFSKKCSKLKDFHSFTECGYRKSENTCILFANPALTAKHRLGDHLLGERVEIIGFDLPNYLVDMP